MGEIEDSFREPMLSERSPTRSPRDKLALQHYFKQAVAEIMGTFLLVFTIACLSATNEASSGAVGLLGFAMSAAFCVTVIIFTTGHISGAHVNPAITVGFAVAKQFPWFQVPLYVGSQITGAVLATLAAKMIHSFQGKLALTTPLAGPFQSLAMETIMTFLMMFLACTVSTNSHVAGNAAALAVPATIGLSVMISAPISGGSLNPARSLGPAIVANSYNAIWIYVIGPFSGSILGALAHKTMNH